MGAEYDGHFNVECRGGVYAGNGTWKGREEAEAVEDCNAP